MIDNYETRLEIQIDAHAGAATAIAYSPRWGGAVTMDSLQRICGWDDPTLHASSAENLAFEYLATEDLLGTCVWADCPDYIPHQHTYRRTVNAPVCATVISHSNDHINKAGKEQVSILLCALEADSTGAPATAPLLCARDDGVVGFFKEVSLVSVVGGLYVSRATEAGRISRLIWAPAD